MNNELSKARIHRSQSKNRYLKWLCRERFLKVKKIKNLCKGLDKKMKVIGNSKQQSQDL